MWYNDNKNKAFLLKKMKFTEKYVFDNEILYLVVLFVLSAGFKPNRFQKPDRFGNFVPFVIASCFRFAISFI